MPCKSHYFLNPKQLPGIACRLLFVLCFHLLGSLLSYGQTDTLKSITRQFNHYQQQALLEKLFLHIDRPLYLTGETMWFKIYATDGTLHQPLGTSKVAYIEVLDSQQEPVLQGKIPLDNGSGHGSLALPNTLNSGNYTVRAYTNWMKNFSPDYYFQQQVTFINTGQNAGVKANKDSLKYAIQFFPEGGNLVQGLKSKVAFKITDKYGKGMEAAGIIADEQGNTVSSFKTLKFGMGSFYFTPIPQKQYTAVITLLNKQSFRSKIPRIEDQGFTFHLEETEAEKLKITVQTRSDESETIYLVGHARQLISVTTAIGLNKGTATFSVNKNTLADGITHFTVFNSRKQPLCERLFFKQPTKKLTIQAASDKTIYGPREKVTFTVNTPNPPKSNSTSNLSLAVYRLDTLSATTSADITNFLYLTSDLHGTIENPKYYLNNTDDTAKEATDNLMLTHGWRRFRWENILSGKPTTFPYLPEVNGHFMQGKVTHAITGKPAENITTYMASPSRHIQLYNAISKKEGIFQFELKNFYGSKEVVVQSNNTRDSIYHFEILNPFSEKYTDRVTPALQLSETFRPELNQRLLQMQVQQVYSGKFDRLFRLPKYDTTAFYGKPSERYLLDDFTRFKVMEEVMREYVPGVMVRIRKDGFHFLVLNLPHRTVFQNNPMVLLDGVPVFNINKIMAFDPLKIKKLDVITNKYIHGPLTYDGLVSYSTYDGDMAGFPLDARALITEYEGLQLQREFYAPIYETATQKESRLPDQRHLLFWKPEITLQGNTSKALSFYTGDEAGKYIMVIQGLSNTGLPGSSTLTFHVKPSL